MELMVIDAGFAEDAQIDTLPDFGFDPFQTGEPGQFHSAGAVAESRNEPFAFAKTLAFHFEDFPFDSHIRLVVPDLADADKIAFVDVSEGKVGEHVSVSEDMGFLPQRLGFGRTYALEVFYVLAKKIEHPVI